MKNILLNIISSPWLYIILSLFILLVKKSSLSYINILDTIKSYYSILYNNKLFSMFIIVPILLAESLNLVTVITDKINDNISVSISILISMFFAYMALHNENNNIATGNASKTQIIKTVLCETQTILNYEILLCIIILLLSMFYQFFYNSNYIIFDISEKCELSVFSIYSFVMYTLFIHLIFNLLVLLKRYDSIKQNNK